MQQFIEKNSPASMMTKTEIEPGHAIYSVDIEKAVEYAEFVAVQKRAEGSTSQYSFMEYEANPKGKDSTCKISIDLDGLMAWQLEKQAIKVSGRDASVPVPSNPMEAQKLLQEAISFNPSSGLKIDGQKLLSAIKGFSGIKGDLENLSFEEKVQLKDQFYLGMDMVKRFIPGVDIQRYGDKVVTNVTPIRIWEAARDNMPPALQQAISVVTAQPEEKEGSVSIRVDYNHLVDMAMAKAKELIEKRGGDSKLERLDTDTMKLVLTAGGVESLLNGAVDKIIEHYQKAVDREKSEFTRGATTVWDASQGGGKGAA